MPSLDLLTSPPMDDEPVDMFELERIGKLIEARLNDYRVLKQKVVGISPGPVITRFELSELAPGVKSCTYFKSIPRLSTFTFHDGSAYC